MKHRLFAVALLIALLSPLGRADLLTMKDGSILEGTITEETRNSVTIETKISNIRTTRTISKRKVASIEYQPLPEGFWETKKPRKTEDDESAEAESGEETAGESAEKRPRPAKRSARETKTMFVVVPIHGGIGAEVNTYGLRQALTNASRQRAEHIVFTIDSPGGYVYQAVEMMEILKDFDDKFQYHAVIEEGAISAASIFAACADNIFVRPGSRLGGAVSFSEDSTGSAAVDAKMNSIWAAEIASRADAKGYPGEMFRAMVVLEAELFQASDGVISGTNAPGSTKIDSSSTILTIRASQLVEAGIAREITGGIDTLGELLGIEDWTERKNIGTKAMNDSGAIVVQLAERLDIAEKFYEDAQGVLKENDPMAHRDYTIYKNMNNNRNRNQKWTYAFDSDSSSLWRKRTDASIHACTDMLAALKELGAINAKAKKYGARHLLVSTKEGDEAYKETGGTLDRLKRWRNKPPYSDLLD